MFRGAWLLLAMAAVLPASAAEATGSLDGFDEFMLAAMKEFKVPGAAVAVVKDGKIILSKGYGFRDVARQLPITGATMFPIASITKSFTVTALGTLVDQGRLEWDKPRYGPYDLNPATARIVTSASRALCSVFGRILSSAIT